MSNHRYARQGQQPYHTAVRPTGGGGPIFQEEWERGLGKPGGIFAPLNGLYGLPARWTHTRPTGSDPTEPTAIPVIEAHQQKLYLGLPDQLETDPVTYEWNAAVARLPTPSNGIFGWQVEASYLFGIDQLNLVQPESEPKNGAIGIIIGNDSLLGGDWADFYFSNSKTITGEANSQPQIWTDPQTIDSEAAGNAETLNRIFVSLIVIGDGTDTTIYSHYSADGISQIYSDTQNIGDMIATQIGFAVRSEVPAPDDGGMPINGWCDYIRVREASYGSLGTTLFGQTGGRNW